VIGRVVLTIAVASVVGLIVGAHPNPLAAGAPFLLDLHDHTRSGGSGGARIVNHASGEFFEMSRYLVIGALLAATFQTLVPRETIVGLGQGLVVSVLAMMALAVVLSICSTVDAFVALAFARSFLPGSVLAFLVFGPMIDIKSVLMLTSTYRRVTVAVMTLLTAQLVLFASVVINVFYA
jgi:uncharacterized membrane protein YraQ (UPF0718 family)